MSQTEGDRAFRRRAAVRFALTLLLLAVASMEWKGYRLGGSNHSIQVPLTRHLDDPSLYARDPLLASFAGYATFFFHGLAAVVGTVGGLELVYFLLYVVFHALALSAVYALAALLFRSPPVSAVACLLYLGQVAGLGAENTYWPRLTHAHAAGAVLLWAVYFHLRGHSRRAMVLCGVVFNLHALYAAHVLALLVADRLGSLRGRGLKRLAADAAMAMALAAPSLAWIVTRHDPVAAAEWPLWLDTLRERSGLHAFPLSVPGAVYARFLLVLILGALGMRIGPGGPALAGLERFALATAGLCLLGLVFSEWLPVRPVIEAQLLRSSKWLTILALACAARLLVASWAWGGIARGAALLCGLGLVLQQPAWTAVGLALYLCLESHRRSLAVVAACGGALFLVALTGAAPLPDRFGLALVVGALSRAVESPAVIACLVGVLVLRSGAPDGGLALRGGAVVLLLFLYVLPQIYRDHRSALRAEPWTDVQLWVREHTPRDALLLTPPHREGFRVFSERAIVGEWKDGTQQFFSWAFAREWRTRMDDLGGGWTSAYDRLPPELIEAIARQHRANFVVVAANRELALPRLYVNDEYAVYRASPPEGPAPAP
jgi:hypothetical protein